METKNGVAVFKEGQHPRELRKRGAQPVSPKIEEVEVPKKSKKNGDKH